MRRPAKDGAATANSQEEPKLPTFIVERELPGANKLTPEQLRQISATSNAVVSRLGVPYTWVLSYVAGDMIYCVHEAPSADFVRQHAIKGEFPCTKVTEVAAFIGPATANAPAA